MAKEMGSAEKKKKTQKNPMKDYVVFFQHKTAREKVREET